MNIAEWVDKRALTDPTRPLLKEGKRTLTNREFNDRVNATAAVLADLGLAPGDRLAALMVNSSGFLELFFACAKLGAILVPVNPHLAAPELRHILRDCAPRMGVVAAMLDLPLAALQGETPDPCCWLRHRGDALEVLPAGESRPLTAVSRAWQPTAAATLNTPLLIMYTSGTTGEPKGAVLTHGNMLFGAIHSLISYGLDRHCVSLVVAPLYHIGALAASATPVIYAGGRLVLREFDNPSDIIDLIARERITYMFAVPVMYEMMAKAPRWAKADFSRVEFFLAGGAPMPVPLLKRYQEEQGVTFAQAYGMTETQRITALDLDDAQRKAGSIGREVFHTYVRIAGDDGREVAPGETGEILVKGPTVFQGYWHRPQETAAALRDGWFHTGDLGRRDAEGYLFIVGRKSDLIICAGKNIYAAEVERAMEAIPGVAEAAAVGLEDARRGEIVAACVVPRPGERLSAAALIQALEGRIAAFKIPKKILMMDVLPRNRAGKIMKSELKERLRQSAERPNKLAPAPPKF